MESVPDTTAEVLNLEDKRAARYRSKVLAELARLEAEADAAAGTLIRSPGAYQAAIKRRLADDPELAAQIDAYRKQYPDLEAVELAERIWADHSQGARPPSRPTNSVDLEAYAALVAAGNRDAAAVLEVLDLPRGGLTMSGEPPYDDAALAARDFLDSPGYEAYLDAVEAVERRRYVHALRRAAAAERAAQELAEDLEEAVDLAEVIELRPTAEEHGK